MEHTLLETGKLDSKLASVIKWNNKETQELQQQQKFKTRKRKKKNKNNNKNKEKTTNQFENKTAGTKKTVLNTNKQKK